MRGAGDWRDLWRRLLPWRQARIDIDDEIGVRNALGAGTGAVRRVVMREGMVLTGIGVTLGLGLALYLSRWLQALVFEIDVVDPWLFGAVALCLAGVAGAASYLPARQATRVDPAAAFREE
jgi:putative ABC transport system permease protein